MKRMLFAILITGFLGQFVFAQVFDREKLDNYFSALEKNNKFMGSVAISQNGKIIYTKSVGFADFENNVKANENSKYRIGSIAKTFTAVLIFKAAEEGKISLAQTIDKYFPTIKNADKITIGNLLNHRSGIYNFTNNFSYLTWHTKAHSRDEMLEIIAKFGSVFEPDSKSDYSNSNYVLLSFILEDTFKKTFSEILAKYITEPLALENTYFGGKINPKNNECYSYRFFENWKIEPETDLSITLGAGGIVSTPSDLVKFSFALFNGDLLKKESLDKMKTIKDSYGMGLIQFPFYDRTAYGHTGGIDGFASISSYFSDGNIAYSLLSNGANIAINNISIAVLSAVFDKPYTIPEFNAYQISSEELDVYLGVYSSVQIPLIMTITKENNILKAQATGQPEFPLEPTERDKFKFDKAGVVIEFIPAEKKMILKQGGGQYKFTKK